MKRPFARLLASGRSRLATILTFGGSLLHDTNCPGLSSHDVTNERRITCPFS
jgi:hypothetical protein